VKRYQRYCANPACRRLVCDVDDKSKVPDVLICQHCGRRNVIRSGQRAKPAEKPKKEKKSRGQRG
jgi:hypothetical protein